MLLATLCCAAVFAQGYFRDIRHVENNGEHSILFFDIFNYSVLLTEEYLANPVCIRNYSVKCPEVNKLVVSNNTGGTMDPNAPNYVYPNVGSININEIVDAMRMKGITTAQLILNCSYRPISDYSVWHSFYEVYSIYGGSIADYTSNLEERSIVIDLNGGLDIKYNFPKEQDGIDTTTFSFGCRVYGMNELTAYLEYIPVNGDAANWKIYDKMIISAADARKGQDIMFVQKTSYWGSIITMPGRWYFRIRLVDNESGASIQTNQTQLNLYALQRCTTGENPTPFGDNEIFRWLKYMPGEELVVPNPSNSCHRWQLYDVDKGAKANVTMIPHDNNTLSIMMPVGTNLNLSLEYNNDNSYKLVFFYDYYGNRIKTDTVRCGEHATPPEAPEIETLKFVRWDKYLYNIKHTMDVRPIYAFDKVQAKARVKDHYTFHEREYFNIILEDEDGDFAGSSTRAMAGDSMTFSLDLKSPVNATVYFQTGIYNNGEWIWPTEKNNDLGTYVGSIKEDEQNKLKTFDQPVRVMSSDMYNTYELSFEKKRAYRFRIATGNQVTYSETFEIEMFYPMYFQFNGDEADAPLTIIFTGKYAKYLHLHPESFLPVQMGDTVWFVTKDSYVSCLQFSRLIKPERSLETGVKDNIQYIIGVGETEKIEVNVPTYKVFFDNVYPVDPEVKAKYGINAYAAREVMCGGSVDVPANPVDKDYIFGGWLNNSTGETNSGFESIKEDYLFFSAIWDDRPAVPTFNVVFQDWDGTQISSQEVKEGANATDPSDKLPARDGYTFVGWDREFSTVVENMTVTALYGKDETYHTVTYVDEDGSPFAAPRRGEVGVRRAPQESVSIQEKVKDGQAAQGVVPVKKGFKFIGWDQDLEHVYSDVVAKAKYKGNSYLISFTIDGEEVAVEEVAEGEMPKGTDAQTKASDAKYDYVFSHFSPDLAEATDDAVYEAVFDAVIHQYNVVFQDWDATELNSQKVNYGEAAKAPADPSRDGYVFQGWNADFSNVVVNMTLTAQYTPVQDIEKSFTVTFKDWDGSIIDEQEVIPGYDAEAPADPVREGYKFTGWDKSFTYVMSDLVITAQYKINQYTVTFVDWDGTPLYYNYPFYGESAQAPSDPYREGYIFTGWDKDYTNVKSDMTVTAQYEVERHVVSFLDWDGTVLKRDTVDYGTTATAPENPTREGYVFLGWSDWFGNVQQDKTVTAEYYVIYYTVQFLDWDFNELKREQVPYGEAATAPDEPKRVGHTFVGWDTDFSNVKGNLLVKPIYEVNTYTVTFLDWDGTEIAKVDVEWGGTVKAPAQPQREGYSFIGWDKPIYNITENTTITAEYEIEYYNVYFYDWDGKLLFTATTAYGSEAAHPIAPSREGYTFTGWDKDFSSVNSDMLVYAQYEIWKFTVRFFGRVDGELDVIKTQTVDWHGKAIAPSVPDYEGYEFTGWDAEFDDITQDLDVFAQYQKLTFTVTIVDWDGTVLSEQIVEWGASAKAISNPTREGYKFTGWDLPLDNVKSDRTITAQYSQISCTVVFVDWDGTELKTQTVKYNDSALAPDDPTREGYTFAGWDKAFNSVKEDLTVTAQYTQNKVYTVTFMGMNERFISAVKVEDGQPAVAPEAPVEHGYTFSGWDKDFSIVTEDMTVTARYTINKYTVKFIDWDGSVVRQELVEYGMYATAPEDPVRVGYKFIGWDSNFAWIDSDREIHANYTINHFIVSFYDWDGTLLEQQDVVYGANAKEPKQPVREGYTFSGWDTDFSVVKSNITVTATYQINEYEVWFYDGNGIVIDKQKVKHGQTAVAPKPGEVEGFHFVGWDADFSEVTDFMNIHPIFEINVYTVQFLGLNDKVLSTQSVKHSGQAIEPEVPVVEGYTFTGWDADFSYITSDLTVKAQYTVKSFNVIFQDWDGTTLDKQVVNWGSSAVEPQSPEREGYAFNGWDVDFSDVRTNLIVIAQYELRALNVVFLGWDGTTLSSQQIKWGESAVAPAAPEREGYTFTGWDGSFTNVKSDITVNATYQINTYTVTFLDWNGSVLKEQVVEWSASAEAPAAPEREGYIFKAWDTDFSNVRADLTVKAQYQLNQFTVIFQDWDDTVLSEQLVDWGNAAIVPAEPQRDGFTFIGWDISFSNVKSDLTVTALYDANKFTVIFKDYDGTLLSSQNISWGESAVAPENPIREGYKFTNWDTDYTNVKSNLIITALYEAINYSVRVSVNANQATVKAENLTTEVVMFEQTASNEAWAHYNEQVRITVVPKEGFAFTQWTDGNTENPRIIVIDKDYDLTATCWIQSFTVQFVDINGNEIESQEVAYGKDATAPTAPEVEGYDFIGWEGDYTNVTSDLIIKALYEEIPAVQTYTVTFVGFNGETIAEVVVEEGKDAEAPEAPQVEGYEFKGWDIEFTDVKSDLTVTAVYEKQADYTPTNLKLTEVALDNDKQLTFSWDAVDGATSYELRLLYEGIEIFVLDTKGLNSIEALLSEILKSLSDVAPGTYTINWEVRSLDQEGNELSDWAQGEAFQVTVDINEGIEDVEFSRPAVRKEFRDGRIYIITPDGIEYNAQGAKIK